MDTLKIAYWIFEYALVMAGYLLLFFVWPHIVFASHLSGKSPIACRLCITAGTSATWNFSSSICIRILASGYFVSKLSYWA